MICSWIQLIWFSSSTDSMICMSDTWMNHSFEFTMNGLNHFKCLTYESDWSGSFNLVHKIWSGSSVQITDLKIWTLFSPESSLKWRAAVPTWRVTLRRRKRQLRSGRGRPSSGRQPPCWPPSRTERWGIRAERGEPAATTPQRKRRMQMMKTGTS